MSVCPRKPLMQAFRSHPTDKVAHIPTVMDSKTGNRVVFWSDIQFGFKNVESIWDGTSLVPFLRDENLDQVMPLRIAYHPGVELELVVESRSQVSSKGDDTDPTMMVSATNSMTDNIATLPIDDIDTNNRSLVKYLANLCAPTHTQPVHTSTAATDARIDTSTAEKNIPKHDVAIPASVLPASVTTEEHSIQSKVLNEGGAHAKDNHGSSSTSAINTKHEDVDMKPAAVASELPNVEGALSDDKGLLPATSPSPSPSPLTTSTSIGSSAQSISSTTVELPTSPQSSLASTEPSPPAQGQYLGTIGVDVVSVTDPIEPKQQHVITLTGSNGSEDKSFQKTDSAQAKKKEEYMEEVSKVAEKVGELDLEQRR